MFKLRLRWRPLVLGGLVVASPFLAVDCASSNSATTAATGGNTSRGLCALLSPSDVEAVIGESVGSPRSVVQGGTTDCTYKSANPSHAVLTRYNTHSSASTFQSEMAAYAAAGHQLTPVPAIGDEAFAFITPSGPGTKTTLVARRGTTQVVVTGTPTMAEVETLARLALTKAGQS